uniref:7TM_GPCR_Srx domain-containing protein n=1 Tax=Strongyloides papillosus TaxID=174720 RepID=A0A0N5C461_STREA
MVFSFLSNKCVSLSVFAENEYILTEDNTIGCFIFNICEAIFVFTHKIVGFGFIFLNIIKYIFEESFFFKGLGGFVFFMLKSLENFISVLKVIRNYYVWWLIDLDNCGFKKSGENKFKEEEYGENTRLLLASLTPDSTSSRFEL